MKILWSLYLFMMTTISNSHNLYSERIVTNVTLITDITDDKLKKQTEKKCYYEIYE